MNLSLLYGSKAKKCYIALIGVALFFAFSFLFNEQLTQTDGSYPSDMQVHLDIALRGKGYSLLYRMMELVYNKMGGALAIAALSSGMLVATWLSAAKLIDVLYERNDFFTSALIALPLLTVAGVYIPVIYEHFYSRQIVTQPFHNITYIGMRLFAVLVILVFHRLFKAYLQKINAKQWLCLALFLVLGTVIKPSFFYGFALSLLLFLIYDFIKTKFKPAPLFKIVSLGCVVFPSLLVMLLQASVLYGTSADEGGSGIALIWGANFVKLGFVQTLLKLLCGLLFPVLVGIANRKELKRTELFIYVMYAIQLAIAILFTETGERSWHGNFYWGVYCAAFFLFLVTFARFTENLIRYKEHSKLYIGFGTLLMTSHTVSGVVYFVNLLCGNEYWI